MAVPPNDIISSPRKGDDPEMLFLSFFFLDLPLIETRDHMIIMIILAAKLIATLGDSMFFTSPSGVNTRGRRLKKTQLFQYSKRIPFLR